MRRAELLEISRILAKVPYEPASSFHEAVQSVWLIHLILQIESNGHSLSYGRMDQYLYPFYEADIRSGKIDDDRADELLCNLWLKTCLLYTSGGDCMNTELTLGKKVADGLLKQKDVYKRQTG